MKLMQTNKGEFGYLKRERKRRIIIAAIMLGVPVFDFHQYVDLPGYQKFYLDYHCSGRISSRL